MKAVIFKDAAGEWRWRLVADNGEPVADSAESYKRRHDARHGLSLVLQTDLSNTTIEYIDRL